MAENKDGPAPQRLNDIADKDLLHYKDDGLTCGVDELPELFSRMARIIQPEADQPVAGEAVLDAKGNSRSILVPEVFAKVGRSCGTHSLKLNNPRAEEHVLMVDDHRLMCFPNAGYSKLAKAMFRQIRIVGHNGDESLTSLAQAFHSESLHVSTLVDAAKSAFGDECIDAFIEGLGAPREIRNLHTENMPIVFLPSPAGGDIQVTPVSPASAFMDVSRQTSVFFLKDERDKNGIITKRQRRGNFARHSISSKPQNITAMIGGGRQRFVARFPEIAGQTEAGIRRMLRGGPVPALREPVLTEIMLSFARFCGIIIDTQRDPVLVRSANNTASAALRMLGDHVLDCVEMALEQDVSFRLPQVNLTELLLRSISRDPKHAETIRQSLSARLYESNLKEAYRQVENALDAAYRKAEKERVE